MHDDDDGGKERDTGWVHDECLINGTDQPLINYRGLYTGPRFYDIWVARDVRGERFLEDPPFVKAQGGGGEGGDGGDWELATALPLAPYPAYCCWNGLAVLHAAPFYQ